MRGREQMPHKSNVQQLVRQQEKKYISQQGYTTNDFKADAMYR